MGHCLYCVNHAECRRTGTGVFCISKKMTAEVEKQKGEEKSNGKI